MGVEFIGPDQNVTFACAGPVYIIIIGQEDAIFCGETLKCGQGSTSVSALVCEKHPLSPKCGYIIPPNTGHDVSFHCSRYDTFSAADM